MILSRANLEVVNVTKLDEKVPELDLVHVTKRGTTVACGGRSMIAVSPVRKEMKRKISAVLKEYGAGGFTFSAGTAREALKDLGKDKDYGGLLEHCNAAQKPDDGEVRFRMTDGKRKRSVAGKLYERVWLPWKKVMRAGLQGRESRRIVVNLKRLIALLNTLDRVASGGTGAEVPVYVEFMRHKGVGKEHSAEQIVLRVLNRKTKQRAIGIMGSYSVVEGQWLEKDKWERSLEGRKK